MPSRFLFTYTIALRLETGVQTSFRGEAMRHAIVRSDDVIIDGIFVYGTIDSLTWRMHENTSACGMTGLERHPGGYRRRSRFDSGPDVLRIYGRPRRTRRLCLPSPVATPASPVATPDRTIDASGTPDDMGGDLYDVRKSRGGFDPPGRLASGPARKPSASVCGWQRASRG